VNKRVLIISPTPTHPPVSGNRARIGVFISCLKDIGCDVHFLHIEREKGNRDDMQNAWGDSYQFTDYQQPKRSLLRKVIRKITGLFDPTFRFQYSIDEWWDRLNNDVLRRLQAKHQFDVVVVEYIFFSKALSCFPSSTLKIIDTHDVFTDRYQHFLNNNMPPAWYSTTQKEERKALNRADAVIAIQDEERRFFANLTRTPVLTVGHLVALTTPTVSNDSYKIFYVASHNASNIASIKWFIDKPFLSIKKTLPEATLIIAGKICDSLPDTEGVLKLGVVSELSEIYEQADVVINPMLSGTGLKIKNVEALGYAKPLITSSVGATGLEDGAGQAYLLADDAQQFAQSVIEVLTDRKLNEKLSLQAHEYAVNWNNNILASLRNVLNI